MKKNLTLLFGLLIAISIKTFAQKDNFTAAEMSDMLKWYQMPPKDGSEEYLTDIKRYFWGRSEMLNNPERAAIAIRDASPEYVNIVLQFSTSFGMRLSERDTPHICRLLRDALATSDSIHTTMRTTPNETFGDERGLGRTGVGTYPSIHAIHGWLSSLLLMEINPEASDSLLIRGLMFGENAVLRGVAWQSDIDAGRLAASIVYAKLHTSDRFQEEMARAKQEFNNLKGTIPPVTDSIYKDSVYIARKKEHTKMKLIEKDYQFTIQLYPIEFDDITGLKMVYIKGNDREYKNIPNAISHVVFMNADNKVKYVLRSIIRHVMDNDEECYGAYVVGHDEEGEIQIGEYDYLELRRMLFHNLAGLENFTSINSRVIDSSEMIPFSPITEYNRKKNQRFFGS